ncbi:DUF2007 domain-containing protein [Granulicella arctica]|uniref:DUF2007 domain-containing protein n=1 Tax=Granulicella arctica TaxID=940613 RepID=A0A7Y9PIW5_9BACT|nr:DUF2007 domain-containing protein [Granulicella arctica]NYF80738.1 hypothetical protein [Granulicella arctica]
MANDLERRLTQMTDDELSHLGAQYHSLTDEAQGLVRAEFKRRSMEAPLIEEEPLVAAFESVSTIRQYRDQAEALLARSVLESAGISCYLRDENTIRMDWLWSNLMGGIRLQVADKDVQAAEALLTQPIPKSIAVAGEPDYEQPHCPRCQSLDVSFESTDAKVGATSILLFGFPLLFRSRETIGIAMPAGATGRMIRKILSSKAGQMKLAR